MPRAWRVWTRLFSGLADNGKRGGALLHPNHLSPSPMTGKRLTGFRICPVTLCRSVRLWGYRSATCNMCAALHNSGSTVGIWYKGFRTTAGGFLSFKVDKPRRPPQKVTPHGHECVCLAWGYVNAHNCRGPGYSTWCWGPGEGGGAR